MITHLRAYFPAIPVKDDEARIRLRCSLIQDREIIGTEPIQTESSRSEIVQQYYFV